MERNCNVTPSPAGDITDLRQHIEAIIAGQLTDRQAASAERLQLQRLEQRMTEMESKLAQLEIDLADIGQAMETAAVLADPDLMAAIESSEADIAAGRTTPWETVKRELGIDTKGDDDAE